MEIQIFSLNEVIFGISEKTVPTSSDKEVIEANLTPNRPKLAFQKAKVFYRMLPFTTYIAMYLAFVEFC